MGGSGIATFAFSERGEPARNLSIGIHPLDNPPNAGADAGVGGSERQRDLAVGDAASVCDGRDNDCDGAIDEFPSDGEVWMQDGDGDGFGFGDSAFISCASPGPGWVTGLPDWDDDCDGIIDEDPVDGTWHIDADGDSFGDPTDPLPRCQATPGRIDNNGDCDDSDPGVNPNASEVCDGIDDDCNGLIDDGAVGGADWFADSDLDGFGCVADQSYADAISECSTFNYTPVVIDDGPENDFVSDAAGLYDSQDWWIGLNDQQTEGVFEWVDGTPLSYDNWAPGEPDDGAGGWWWGGEDCVELNPDNGQWSDTDCGFNFNNIVCESR